MAKIMTLRSLALGARFLATATAVLPVPTISRAQAPQPPVLLRPGEVPGTGASFPLSWTDPIFANVATSGSVVLSNGGLLTDKSITANGPQASVQCNGACTLTRVRISSGEGVRVGGSGAVVINSSWIESQGVPGDHADSIQCYAPQDIGSVSIYNSTVHAHNDNATAGLFSADGYQGDFHLENVLFWGGPYGLRIHTDGKPTNVYMKNVYFVGPFLYSRMLIYDGGSGVKPVITHWENVRDATIENGKLVPGTLIAQPN